MRGLVVRDGLRELHGLAGELAAGDGLRVEGGLEVLEREREVEDVDVARRGPRRAGERARGQRAQERAAAEQRAAAEHDAAQSVATRDAGALGSLLQRAVGVDLAQRQSIVVSVMEVLSNQGTSRGQPLARSYGETRQR